MVSIHATQGGARMVSSAFHSTEAVVSQVGALWTGLQACGD